MAERPKFPLGTLPCPRCGHPVVLGERFCPNCGARPDLTARARRSMLPVWLILGGVSACVIAVGGTLILGAGSFLASCAAALNNQSSSAAQPSAWWGVVLALGVLGAISLVAGFVLLIVQTLRR